MGLEFNDIQGLALYGYGHQKCCSFIFLQVKNAPKAKRWLSTILPYITTAEVKPPEARKTTTSINIAFTCKGLEALGASKETMNTFSQEFVEGMSELNRARILGDTENSAPDQWELGGPRNEAIHILLLLYSINISEHHKLLEKYRNAINQDHGIALVLEQDTCYLPADQEHFGFKDGISQPAIEGSPVAPKPGDDVIKAGEFILGYKNQYNKLPYSPKVAMHRDPFNILPEDLELNDHKDFGRNGSYMVFRKLEQNVTAFWNYFDKVANGDKDKKLWLASKCVGRWPSGAPLTLSPDKDDPALGEDKSIHNKFKYRDKDLEGLGCPIGAHIRRAHPRDSLEPNAKYSILVSNRHRILRRGRSYGVPKADLNASEDDGIQRGLLFIALNANIRRQFEFIQQTWMNDPKFNGLYDNNDPISSKESNMVIQKQPVREYLKNIPRFVTVKGGAYFFMPGLKALKWLAQ